MFVSAEYIVVKFGVAIVTLSGLVIDTNLFGGVVDIVVTLKLDISADVTIEG